MGCHRLRARWIRCAHALVLLLVTGSRLEAQDSTYVAHSVSTLGPQLMVVYVGASACKPCRSPEFKVALRKALFLGSERAKEQGASYFTSGVALDETKAKGLDVLEPHEQFDELLVGGGWVGTGASRYIWADTSVVGAIPMLLVVKRTIGQGSDNRYSGLGSEDVLVRLTGVSEISSWISRGAPIPEKAPATP